jgi:hypothetical protein
MDVHVIYHNAGGINEPGDPTGQVYPWRLHAIFRAPEFKMIAFIGLYGGSEEIIVEGKSKKALEKFADENGLRNHPRLRSLTIKKR